MIGADISHYQSSVDWPRVTLDFVVVKATEGKTYTDAAMIRHIAGAKSRGIPVGAYHFGRPQSDPGDQARFYHAACAPLGLDLPPVLDLETTDARTPAEVNAWARAFLAVAGTLFGRPCWLYSYGPFVRTNLGTAQFAPYWHAQYGPTMTLPPGWRPKIWQYTSSGQVPGILGAVDMDRWLGTAAEFAAFCGRVPAPTPVPIPPHLEADVLNLTIYRNLAHRACITVDGRHSHGVSEPLRIALVHGGATSAPDSDADFAAIDALPEWPAGS